MDLDKLLNDADAARNLKPHKGDVAGIRTDLVERECKPERDSTIASRLGMLGFFILLFLGGSSSENDDDDNGNILCGLDEFRAGDYDMSKSASEQCVVSPYLRMGSWMR